MTASYRDAQERRFDMWLRVGVVALWLLVLVQVGNCAWTIFGELPQFNAVLSGAGLMFNLRLALDSRRYWS